MKNLDRIDPNLFEKIRKELGCEKSTVYNKVTSLADKLNVPRGIAAIKLASTLGISITKYADADYYRFLQTGSAATVSSNPLPSNGSATRQRVKIVERPKQVLLDLSKITSGELREIISRDVGELNIAISSGIDKTSKTCMILSGSITEALILERLTRDSMIKTDAIALAQKIVQDKPSHPTDPLSWTLANLVAIAQQGPNTLLPADSAPQIGQLRYWRNLIHPGRELKEIAKNRISTSPQRAQNAIGFLEFVAHELAK